MPGYLAYDVKGIQQFIFSVPKLKYMIGASLLIDEFDRERIDEIIEDACGENVNNEKAEKIFSGGGKGVIWYRDDDIGNAIHNDLRAAAWDYGLDLRLGRADKLSKATQAADNLYPYIPENLDGEPCQVSGLWPTLQKKGEHPLIRKRADRELEGGGLDKRILDKVLAGDDLLPADLVDIAKKDGLAFVRAVRSTREDDDDTRKDAKAADHALGNRNRWAIVAMDGNDMGSQHRSFQAGNPTEDEERLWLKTMSQSLMDCTCTAFLRALSKLIHDWWKDVKDSGKGWEMLRSSKGKLVLPFRPLIVGGDDIVCLCHSSHALTFVQTLSKEFTDLSKTEAERQKHAVGALWPATGGSLTISAGVLFCKVTYPLHTALPYAESLLASAKGGARELKKPEDTSRPTPAAVDWEEVTDSLLDTPANRRKRDLFFHDQDIGKDVWLTCKPYLLEEAEGDSPLLPLERLLRMSRRLHDVPRSLLADALRQLQKPWAQRVQWLAAAEKHKSAKELVKLLEEYDGEKPTGAGWITGGKGERRTCIPDAIFCLEESRRMASTAKGEDA